MKKRKLKIFSFFSGSGFLDLGFEMNGFEIQFVNEFHPAFMNAYQYSREKMGLSKPIYGYFQGDINEFLMSKKNEIEEWIRQAREDGSLVGFIGGPPCPDFSIAGKNKGREGDNGKLSLSYTNLIIQMKPDFFLFENVQEAGFTTTERLTNALEYGAPQDRDRILLFGVQKNVIGKKSLEEFPWEKYQKYSVEQTKKLPWPNTNAFVRDSVTICPSGIPKELTVQYWFEKNDVANHPNENDYFQPRSGLVRMQTIEEGDVSKKSYKRLHRWRYSPTVAYGNNEVHLHPYKERRISAAEAMSLQTLPKAFELPKDMTLTDKFKTIGNGVPYLLSCGIARTIYDFLLE